MIQYADIHTRAQVRQLWKTVFGDSDAYMDIYFREKYRDERTLVYLEDENVVASLQMLPYNFTFCDTEIPITYFSGLCTLPQARKKGYMAALIRRAFAEMAMRHIPLALLVPQETWLLNFYKKYGFAQTFDAGKEELPSLKTLLDKHSQHMEEAYREFDSWYRQKDMTVQKTVADFTVIVEEARLFDFPPKKKLIGMARIIDAEKLLSVFSQHYRQKRFSILVEDAFLADNTAAFTVENGIVEKNTRLLKPAFHVDVHELATLLLGYHTAEKEKRYSAVFPQKETQMDFMLE